ncbi:Acetyltransferase, GNAT family [Cribrihabitans marinus]|uniref:Acetyltransferase, GNAT family n=1 Tax=Cribrihabitans marinus TaxID=1227549 RepID=A0A1H6ZYJ9_9RHOB|nr:GNAT family N-acetyltransferase [Cribrihabitans marinus]GGH29729.1 N-acetyltransferase [Cribrihabitans marinus]SEJ58549.1 Acetyltransferase, GNAT family [Cribrihabitans marinus]
MSFVVRPTSKADLAAVDALLARSYPRLLKADYPPSVLVTALPLISRAQPALLASGTYYVAEEAAEILGAGGWTRDGKRADLGHIRHVATDHRALRRGVGRAILRHALDMARAAGVTEMACWSTRTAVPFYAALGFETLGPMQVELGPGIRFPAVRMKRRLS